MACDTVRVYFLILFPSCMSSRSFLSIVFIAGILLAQTESALAISIGISGNELRNLQRANRMMQSALDQQSSSSSSVSSSVSSSSSSAKLSSGAMRAQLRKAAAKKVGGKAGASSSSATVENIDVGLVLLDNADFMYVTSVDAYSAADLAGIKGGDTIKTIEGKKITSAMSLEEVLQMLNGPAGSVVRLTVGRQNAGEKSITITRNKKQAMPAFALSTVDSVPVLKLTSLDVQSMNDAEKAIKDKGVQNSAKLILDLRDNPQANLTDVLNVIGFFVPKNQKVGSLQISANSKGAPQGLTSLYTNRDPVFGKSLNLVLLMGASHGDIMRLIAYALYKTDNFHVVKDETQLGRYVKGPSLFTASNGKQYDLADIGALHSIAMVDLSLSPSLYPILDASVSNYIADGKDHAMEKALSYLR